MNLKNEIVALDPGHGGSDSGAMYNSLFHRLFEKDIALSICQRVKKMLLSKRAIPVLTRVGDYDVSLKERCRIANEVSADYFISVHTNADPDPDTEEFKNKQAKGEEIWYYEGSKEGLALAQRFKYAVDDFFLNEPFRGIKSTKGLYTLRRTRMPAILVECGFIDNSATAEALSKTETLEKIACLISDTLRIL